MAGACAITFVNPTAFGVAPQAPIDNQVGDAHDDLASANQKVNEVTKELEAAQKQLGPAEARLAAAQQTAAATGAAAAAAEKALGDAKVALVSVQAEVAKIDSESQSRAAHQKLEGEEKAAKLLRDNPELLRLRELEVLREIGMKGGNHFYVGMDKLVRREPEKE